VNRDSYRDRNVLDPPDPPETRSPAAANGRANRKDFQHHEHIESHESPQARGDMPYSGRARFSLTTLSNYAAWFRSSPRGTA
jgi:hypothetical protein